MERGDGHASGLSGYTVVVRLLERLLPFAE